MYTKSTREIYVKKYFDIPISGEELVYWQFFSAEFELLSMLIAVRWVDSHRVEIYHESLLS